MIVSSPPSRILSRWQVDPPVIHAAETGGDMKEIVALLRQHEALRLLTPASSANCTDCGHRSDIIYVPVPSGGTQGYSHCPDCGVHKVTSPDVERLAIDTPGLLALIFRESKVSVQEFVGGSLWRVGKASCGGRSRDVWFARNLRRNVVDRVVADLKRVSKSIVFTPTEILAGKLHALSGNLVIGLDSVITINGRTVELDIAYVENRILDAGFDGAEKPKRPARKRGDRTAKIELLKNALIEHLRSARDHAFATKEQTGTPKLLPRPTQKALALMTDLTESDVSRCLKDSEARELQIYWNLALELDQLMNWPGSVSRGRKRN